PRETVRIAVLLAELHDLQRAARFGVVLDQPRASIVAGDQPDRVLVEGDAVRARHAVGDQQIGLTASRADAEDSAQPQRRNPQLAVDVLEAVAAAAVLARAE